MEEKPEIICIEETRLKPRLDFIIPAINVKGETDRTYQEGCATFINNRIQYRGTEIDSVLECVVKEEWTDWGKIINVNL